MPRKHVVQKREIVPDPKFNSVLVAKFVNNMMRRGKRGSAEQILYDALDIIEKKIKDSPLKVFEQAVHNVKPMIEVKSRRVGGSTYQVPVEIRDNRQKALSMRWIIKFAKNRNEKSMTERLAGELMDAASNKGASIKQREEVHKMADANKAFAHYRW